MRCTRCDRDDCPCLDAWHTPMNAHDEDEDVTGCRACHARRDCRAHAVDWRTRALAVEARVALVIAEIEHDVAIRRNHDHARATGGQTCGTGGRLSAAQPSLLAYLEGVVRDLQRK